MNDEKWHDLVNKIETQFRLLEKKTEPYYEEDDVGGRVEGKMDTVSWEMPQGKRRLIRISRPKIIDKKVHYHRAGGGAGRVEYVLSESEWTHKVRLEAQNSATGDWEEEEYNL